MCETCGLSRQKIQQEAKRLKKLDENRRKSIDQKRKEKQEGAKFDVLVRHGNAVWRVKVSTSWTGRMLLNEARKLVQAPISGLKLLQGPCRGEVLDENEYLYAYMIAVDDNFECVKQ